MIYLKQLDYLKGQKKMQNDIDDIRNVDHESGSLVPVSGPLPGSLPTPSVPIFRALTWNIGH